MQDSEPTLKERIGVAADTSPYLTRTSIVVDAERQRVVVRGTVASYYEKQMAQETLLRIDGVTVVENHLKVVRPPRRDVEGEALARLGWEMPHHRVFASPITGEAAPQLAQA